MKNALYALYLVYQFLVIAACIYLPITFDFGIEYVLLSTQAIVVIIYFILLKSNKTKHKSEFSLFVSVLFVGIIYVATLHLLVIILSAIILAGWFSFSGNQENIS